MLTHASSSADVVADHDQTALVRAEELAQPHDRVGVEVVGGLVEEQRLRTGEQDPGQLDPSPLAAGQGAERLAEQPVLDAEAGRDPRGFGLGRVAAAGVQVGVGRGVAPHRLLGDGRVVARHLRLGVTEPAYDRVQAARGQDPVAGEHAEVARARVLGQVAHGPGRGDLAGRGHTLAGQDPGERGLAGAVASDEADPVAGPDPEAHAVHQQPGAGTHLELVGGDHGGSLRRRVRCGAE